MTACSVADCDRRSRSRGWCGTHYERWRSTGATDKRFHVPSLCVAPGCHRVVFTNGWCHLHYSRMRHTGRLDVLPVPTVAERLVAGTAILDNGCWMWTGGAQRANGYGAMSVDGRLQYVHRLSYELHVGPIPAGLTIDHLCRTRLCVRPEHLEPVTRAENTRRALLVRYGAEVPHDPDTGEVPDWPATRQPGEGT